MKHRFVKRKLKKMEGLPLSIYFLESDTMDIDKTPLKLEEAKGINSKGYRVIGYYKPVSKL
ncbi:hypothetical protein GQF61_05170 [Sphingobacterium sp. DK4209]|uniref:Uncharacterized protein n=1 Tax=Sphingobacterium zhuxiongii TaxID=2662364 RepID=A0A5Q0QGF3_9SPHI|nr:MULTISPECIES: hypothetical protein [unclassified Sphingobacterium]MVZ65235.1 hypothetical protein [Sphingobacterium sp. DK4209]QGA26330.1 hypothetical protein GFH32_08315 [Sphingobacterium sp. dk4302]